jgi:glycosyl transferase family 25
MNRLSDYFGSVYLINLPERVDRLKSAKKQFAHVGWKTGQDGVQTFPALRFADRAGFPSIGTRGCFHSHLECLRRAQAEGRRSVLILEDDIALSPALPRLTPAITSLLAAVEWDFVYFGHYAAGDILEARANTSKWEVRFHTCPDEILGGHFYAVSGRILPRLIANLNDIAKGPEGDRSNGPMPVDGAYNNFRRNNPDVRCLIVDPKLGWQTSSASDITPHVFDRISFLRPVATVLRDLKRSVASWGS